ncbi:MAG: ATP-binding protein [Bacteroidetes bacterium]|jgi:serine/threonine-protein kinase RsbW|nr:ATP-binding protein [Bacteroidota bacterium]MBX7127804.1 ATP-binding protein [Flavobacteriales bacterium]HMU12598.1 ATP-binding protein [Flavobacteriales bacterium]HMW95910.1 ATP-binding protein [Flavobacteriales bacterium]HMZ47334.1 ATP-binding protein [Flavobacteriales bacterium]
MAALTEDVQYTRRIDFPAKAENIALAEKLIDEACQKHGVHESHYGNILIALTEAVNNAIHHGNRLDPSKSVGLGYQVKGDKIVFVVSDEGPGFDFQHLPDPTDPQNIEKPHGRGVFLMRALADSVEFSDNGATVAMAFGLQPVKE